jgi:hypothetical protein
MITLPAGVSLQDVYDASRSVPREQLQSSPFAQRVTAALDLYGRALKAIGREGRGKVTSLLRSSSHNETVGGAQHSHHLSGYAVDFYIPDVDHGIVYEALKPLHSLLRFDELAVYDDHVHLSADPRARGKLFDFRKKPTTTPKPGIARTSVLVLLALLGLVILALKGTFSGSD